jgi:hypothetical protein
VFRELLTLVYCPFVLVLQTLSRSQPDFVAAVNGHWGRGISRGLSFSFCSGVDSTSAEEESLGSLRPQLPRGQAPGTPSPATPRTGTSTGSRAVRVEPGRVPFSLAPAPSPHLPDISPAPSRGSFSLRQNHRNSLLACYHQFMRSRFILCFAVEALLFIGSWKECLSMSSTILKYVKTPASKFRVGDFALEMGRRFHSLNKTGD